MRLKPFRTVDDGKRCYRKIEHCFVGIGPADIIKANRINGAKGEVMEPIQGLERLRELLRQKSTGKTSKNQRSSQAKTAKLDEHQRVSATLLEQQLKSKIQQLEQASASRQVIARVVIESVLAWEYSDRLHNEPKFSALVQQVHRHIEDEPKLNSAFEQFIDQLSH